MRRRRVHNLRQKDRKCENLFPFMHLRWILLRLFLYLANPSPFTQIILRNQTLNSSKLDNFGGHHDGRERIKERFEK